MQINFKHRLGNELGQKILRYLLDKFNNNAKYFFKKNPSFNFFYFNEILFGFFLINLSYNI
jgi:hypothetical protein